MTVAHRNPRASEKRAKSQPPAWTRRYGRARLFANVGRLPTSQPAGQRRAHRALPIERRRRALIVRIESPIGGRRRTAAGRAALEKRAAQIALGIARLALREGAASAVSVDAETRRRNGRTRCAAWNRR